MEKDILDELGNLASKHKLVPFLGAGCSIDHLDCDWDMIKDELGNDIGFEGGDHLETAQKYVDAHGKRKLCKYLENKLLIDTFDDDKGCSTLAVMSLGLGVIYTTNQDNVMEKCFEKYGRTYSKIVELEDLAESTPGDKLYFKFHGDLSNCDSVVFTNKDYDRRIEDEDHFLNIRIKSDLLAKNLLFIGYSFRDKNIQLLLKEFNILFKDKLPPIYMVAWEYTDELKEICKEYNIKLINPLTVFPDSKDNIEAFNRFLKALVEQTWILKDKIESDLLRSPVPVTDKIICKFEIDSLQKIVEEMDFKEACEKFGAIMGLSLIPKDFEPAVVTIFKKLALKCSSSSESDDLNNLGLFLYISNEKCRFEALSYLMVTANVRENELDTFNPTIGGITGIKPEEYIHGIPNAIKSLVDQERLITDVFRANVTKWVEQSGDIDNSHLQLIKEAISEIWDESTTLEDPFKRKERLKGVKSRSKPRSANEIYSNMVSRLPKIDKKPFEE